MPQAQKTRPDAALFDSFSENFELRPPVYEFDFRSPGRPGGDNGDSPAGDAGAGLFDGVDGIVDRVEDLAKLPFADGSAGTVICRGALEHVFEPRRAMDEMHRILMPGGVLYACVPGNRSRCGGNHFWHFTPQAMQRLLQSFQASVIGWQGPDGQPHTIFAVACKGAADAAFLRGMGLFPQRCQRRLDDSARRVGWIRKFKQAMVAWAFSPMERRRFADYYRAQFAIHMPAGNLCKHRLLESCLGEIQSGSRLDLWQ